MPFLRRGSARVGAKLDESRAGDSSAARTAGIGLLARREYASGELAAALVRRGYTAGAIAQALVQLGEEGLLDDGRYAENLVRSLSRRGQGVTRIRQALTEAGIGPQLLEAALATAPDFFQLAGAVRRRRFGDVLPTDWPEKAKQMRFLQYRGFTADQISAALAGCCEDSDSALGGAVEFEPEV